MDSIGDASKIMALTEVAGYLKVTEKTISRLPAAKQALISKFGGTLRFSHADIDLWIKSQPTLSTLACNA